MSTPRWICDDEPSPRFPVYTRGNAGEVAPNVMTPLLASLVGEASAAGQRRALLDLGMFRPRDFESPGANGTGIFGGYLYANLSMMRVAGVRAPGMTPLDADRQVSGLSEHAPPYRPRRGDASAIATLDSSWTMARRLLRPDLASLDHDRLEVDRRCRGTPPPGERPDDELISLILAVAPRWSAGMRRLLHYSALASSANALLDRLAERAGFGDGAALGLTAGLGTIDSAAPALRLWALGRDVTDSATLTTIFDERGDPRAFVGHPDVDRFLAGFDAFIAAHGARGPDEWELASPTWGTDPVIAIEAIDRLRRAPTERDPVVAGRRLAEEREALTLDVRAGLPRPGRPLLDRILRSAQLYAAGRERAKAIFIDDLYPVRCAAFELAARVRARGGPEDRRDFFLVIADELRDFVAHPGAFTGVIEERRRLRDFLQDREPPFVFEGAIPDPATWPVRSAQHVPVDGVLQLSGDGVCPGIARGTVRIVRDPTDPRALEPGDILVAPLTDPAWTPLFLAVAGVVVEVGAQMSHAAIVARELGIPAIVGVAHATTQLVDGQSIEIDGSAGTVTRI